jgi:hypothetical protein
MRRCKIEKKLERRIRTIMKIKRRLLPGVLDLKGIPIVGNFFSKLNSAQKLYRNYHKPNDYRSEKKCLRRWGKTIT